MISDWVLEVVDCSKFLVGFVGSLLVRLGMAKCLVGL